jgi:hypothetical protein
MEKGTGTNMQNLGKEQVKNITKKTKKKLLQDQHDGMPITENGVEKYTTENTENKTQVMVSNAPYPSIDEVESHSTISLDAAKTHVLEQMYCAAKSTQALDNPLATLNAQANAAKAIAELVKAKVDIFKAYKGR